KNPDAAELVRGKTGRVYGALMAMLTTMKGIPLAYNKDMQEDKEQFFDALDTVSASLEIMCGVVSTMKVNKDNMRKAVKGGFLNATEVADYLVNNGMPFRDAHKVSGQIVLHCEKKNCAIEDISLNEFKIYSSLFEEDIFEFIDYDNILKKGIKKEIL
ncbi:MAG: argininosuccinate lyase, partial [Clostridium sp.]